MRWVHFPTPIGRVVEHPSIQPKRNKFFFFKISVAFVVVVLDTREREMNKRERGRERRWGTDEAKEMGS